MDEVKREKPKWGKAVKNALTDHEMKITEYARTIGYSREYLSAVLNGSVISPPLQKHICDDIYNRFGVRIPLV